MSVQAPDPRSTTWRGIAVAVAGLVVSVSSIAGVVAPLACVFGLFLVLAWTFARWVGWSAAVALSTLGSGVLAYLVAVMTHGSTIPLPSALAVTMLAAAVGGSWAHGKGTLARRFVDGFSALVGQRLPHPRQFAPLAIVPLWWTLVAAVAVVKPGSSAHDWALSGDSANNVLFSKDIVTANGLRLVSENPVPLPHLLVALGMPSGSVPTVADVTAYVWVWHLSIAATAGLAALMGFRMARAGSLSSPYVWLSALVPASLVVSWAVTGYASAFGFINVHVALAIVFASVALMVGRINAAVAVAAQVGAAILLVLTWSPLAVVPAAAAVAPALALLRRSATRRDRLFAAVAVLGGAVFLLARYRSSAQGLSDAVASQAGVVAPSQRSVIALVAVVFLGVVVCWRPSRAISTVVGTITAAVALALAATTLLVGAWTYYPMKMAWFAVAIVAIVVAAAAPTVVATRANRVAWLTPGAVVVATGLLVVGVPVWAQMQGRAEWIRDPAASIVFPGGGGDAVFDALNDMHATETSLLWSSGVTVEREADFWAASLRSGVFHPVDEADARFGLRALAYAQMHPDDTYVCEFARRWDGPLVVRTSSVERSAQLVASCDAPNLTVTHEAN